MRDSVAADLMTARDRQLPEPEVARAAGWFRLWRTPNFRRHPIAERVVLALFGVCMVGQLWVIQAGVAKSVQIVPNPVSYPGPWRVDKHQYHPGEAIRLRYTRRSAEKDIILWQIDNWENLDTGELYPGALLGRHVGTIGAEEIRQVRELPQRMEPGRYVLRGWISAQTAQRSLPTEYTTEPFKVVKR